MTTRHSPSPDPISEIFRSEAPFIRRCAARVFRDRATVEDALMEVMLRTLTRGHALLDVKTQAQRRKWLRVTTLRTCWDLRDRLLRERPTETGDADGTTSSDWKALQARDQLQQGFAGLDDRDRQLAVLRFEKGLSKSELHRETGRSRPFINKRLKRILRRFERLDNAA